MKSELAIVCRARGRACALFCAHVAETMRPLPVEPLVGADAFVRGLSIIRGVPIPVLDAGLLLASGGAAQEHVRGHAEPERSARFVVVRTGQRRVALAVDAVLGIRALAPQTLAELPPLLRHASAEIVSAVGTLDAELLVVLGAAHLVPAAVWERIGAGDAPA